MSSDELPKMECAECGKFVDVKELGGKLVYDYHKKADKLCDNRFMGVPDDARCDNGETAYTYSKSLTHSVITN